MKVTARERLDLPGRDHALLQPPVFYRRGHMLPGNRNALPRAVARWFGLKSNAVLSGIPTLPAAGTCSRCRKERVSLGLGPRMEKWITRVSSLGGDVRPLRAQRTFGTARRAVLVFLRAAALTECCVHTIDS